MKEAKMEPAGFNMEMLRQSLFVEGFVVRVLLSDEKIRDDGQCDDCQGHTEQDEKVSFRQSFTPFERVSKKRMYERKKCAKKVGIGRIPPGGHQGGQGSVIDRLLHETGKILLPYVIIQWVIMFRLGTKSGAELQIMLNIL